MTTALSLASLPVVSEAEQELVKLRIRADFINCTSCRSADTRDCENAETRCCGECNHPMPAAQIVAAVRAVEAALAKAAAETPIGGLR